MRKIFLTMVLSAVCVVAGATPKYVFMFIGDGMGMGHVMAADTYHRRVLGNEGNILMMQFPVASAATTYSYSSPVTDSAAAGTALAAGVKTNNYTVGVNPDSVAVTSIATELKAQGYGVGIVTSVAYDDATPAAFYAHQVDRKMYAEINRDGARSNFDFIAGAYTLMARKDTAACQAIFDDYRANGYAVAHSLKELSSMKPAEKVLLTAGSAKAYSNIGYTIDSIPAATHLEDLTEACLHHLERVSPDKFFMMVEAGNIDHAAHGNDGAGVVKEVLNFQNSIRLAYEFYLKHPEETLIVVTADHDTGGMTVGVANGGRPTMENIDWQRSSKEKFSDYCVSHNGLSWNEMKQVLSDKLGFWNRIQLTEKEEAGLKNTFEAMATDKGQSQKTLYKEFDGFAAVVFDLLNRKNGIGFTTINHTGNMVPVYAVGEGCEAFSDLNNNIEIPQKIRELMESDR